MGFAGINFYESSAGSKIRRGAKPPETNTNKPTKQKTNNLLTTITITLLYYFIII